VSGKKTTHIKDISDLFRLSLCILASIVVYAAGYITHRLNNYDLGINQNFLTFLFDNQIIPPTGLFIGFFIPFSLVAANHTVNDYFDYEGDVINERIDRPIARGSISLNTARNLVIGLYSFAFFLTAILVFLYRLDIVLLFLVPILIFIGISYNLGIKRYGLLGNIWVSIGYVFPFLIGPFLVGMDDFAALNILVLCAFVFFLALGREILKDIMDIEGDKKEGMRSAAIVYGARWAARLSFTSFLITIFLGVSLMFLAYKNNIIFFIGLSLLSLLLIYTSIILIRNPDLETGIKGRKYTRWSLWWATAVAFLSSFFLP
jgi:geranylgeranylglycerol-phosphate geranylgeranyltransferase